MYRGINDAAVTFLEYDHAQDDKEAVGHTMGLEEEQANFLSNLKIGRAILFNGNWPKAIQVQVTQTYRTDTTPDPKEAENIRKAALEFYASDWKRGVFACSDILEKKPSEADLEKLSKSMKGVMAEFRRIALPPKDGDCKFEALAVLLKTYGCERVAAALLARMYSTGQVSKLKGHYDAFFSSLVSGKDTKSIRTMLACCGKGRMIYW